VRASRVVDVGAEGLAARGPTRGRAAVPHLARELSTPASSTPNPPNPPTAPRWGIVDWFATWIGSFVAVIICQPIVLALTGQSGVSDSKQWPLSTAALLQIPLYGVMLGGALVITKRKGNGPVVDLGLRAAGRDLPLGLVSGVVLQGLGNVIYVPIYWLTDVTSNDVDKQSRELADKAHGAGVVLFLLVVVIAAPIVEEVFFRGFLLRALDRRVGTGWAVVLSAAVFALSHFDAWEFPALFLFGLGAALLAVRTGRLAPGVVAHLGFNAVAAFFLLR